MSISRRCGGRLLSSFLLVNALAGVVFTAGCSKSEPIRTYTISRQVPYEGEERMIATLTPLKDQAWTFKLTAPVEEVDRVENEVLAFLKTVTFLSEPKTVEIEQGSQKSKITIPAGTPEWTLPGTWFEREGNQFRYKTLLIPAEPSPLELTVSKITLPRQNQQEYMLANVNRWRGQLGLPEAKLESLSTKEAQIKVGGVPSVWVDITGDEVAGGMRPPFANMSPDSATASAGNLPANHPTVNQGSASTDMGADTPDDTASGAPFTFKAPDSWRATPPSQFRLAGYVAGDETLITVTSLGGGGTLTDNVNRWRNQVGLPPLSDAEIADTVTKLNLDGREVIWSESVGSEETIVGVMIPDPSRQTYFIKLRGPNKDMGTQLDEFRAFVDSFSFGGDKSTEPEPNATEPETPDSETPATTDSESESETPDSSIPEPPAPPVDAEDDKKDATDAADAEADASDSGEATDDADAKDESQPAADE